MVRCSWAAHGLPMRWPPWCVVSMRGKVGCDSHISVIAFRAVLHNILPKRTASGLTRSEWLYTPPQRRGITGCGCASTTS